MCFVQYVITVLVDVLGITVMLLLVTISNYHIHSCKVPNMNKDKLLKFLNEVNMSACPFVSVCLLLVTVQPLNQHRTFGKCMFSHVGMHGGIKLALHPKTTQ